MVKKSKSAKDEYFDSPLNRALREVMGRRKLSNPKAAKRYKEAGLSISHAQIGNYRRGRNKVSTDFITGWKQVFGDDLNQLAENKVSTKTPQTKTNMESEFNDVGWYKKTIDVLISQNGDSLKQNVLKFDAYKDRTERTIAGLEVEKERLWELVRRAQLPNDGQ